MIIDNYIRYERHRKNLQTSLIYCDHCNSLFFSEDNVEYKVEEQECVTHDMFGDVERVETKNFMVMIHRCPYCRWKYRKRL